MASRKNSFAYHRWIPFAMVIAALAGVAGLALLWAVPTPQAACDQTNLTEAHISEVRALMQWSHRGLLHLTAIGGVLAAVLLYFQIGHWLLKGAAPWLVASALAGLVSLVAADAWIRRAERWVSYQAGSCLEEALREPWVASHVTWTGGTLRSLLPNVEDLPRWSWLMLVDATAMAIAFIALAWLVYLGGRWKFRY